MRSRLAAVVAALLAVAVIAPPDGIVAHRHAGGEHLHVHADLTDDRHGSGDHDHAHAGDDHDHQGEPDHHHEHAHRRHDHGARPGEHDDDGPGLTPGAAGSPYHLHATLLLHRAVGAPPPALAPPRPRATLAAPPPRKFLWTVARPTRSRAPPLRSS